MLTLYTHNMAVCAQKVRIALSEKKLEWRKYDVDLLNGEQYSESYVKIHPKSVVPALDHDGNIIIETTVILEYLEDAFPDNSLRPSTPVGRARMREWTKTPDEGLHMACGNLSFAAVFADQTLQYYGAAGIEKLVASIPDPQIREMKRELFEKRLDASTLPGYVRIHEFALQRMEKCLETRNWLAGEDFSLADIAMLPYIWRLERLNLDRMWANRPHIARWFAAAKARPSWDEAIEACPPLKGDFTDDLRKLGVDIWPQIEPMITIDS